MNVQDAITLQAYLIALAQLDTPLSEALQQQMHRVGIALAQHQPDAIADLATIVHQHPRLHELYDAAYQQLQNQYGIHAGNQTLLVLGMTPTQAAALANLTAQVLIAEDMQTTVIRFAKRERSRTTGGVRLFVGLLRRAVAEVDQRINAILKALEKRPLTTENLAYAMQMPLEQAQTLVQRSWQAGYIDLTTGNPLPKLLPLVKPRLQFQECSAKHSYFILTARGHFRLHPLMRQTRGERPVL